MEPDSMELKVICCKDLKAFNFFQKLNIYVVVSIVNEDGDSTPSPTNNKNKNKNNQNKKQKQKTPIDREGDGNPEWNHVMRFDLKDILIISSSSCSSFVLEFDLRSEGTILGDKTIGRVRVPFEDLINEFNGGGAAVRFVSYQVRTTDGIPNGVLDFSFKPIFIHSNNNNNSNSNTNSVEDNNNKFGNESLAVGNSNSNSNGGVDDDVTPLIYPPPMPSTSCYPPQTHNPSSPAESYYPKIDQFQDPSPPPEIHYPTTLEIHSPPSEFHNPSPLPQPEVYYHHPNPQPQPQVDYNLFPPPPYHHHHHPLPQVAYYPPPPLTQPLFYPPPPSTDPYRRLEFERGNPNPAAYGYPNYWASTPPPPPIHW